MAGNKPIIYVDTCVFIAMLTGEQRKGDESLHVAGFAAELERKEVIAVTSALTKGEILECTLTDQQKLIMERLIRPPKVQRKDVSTPILDLAAEIRNYYQAEKQGGHTNLPTVDLPDAIHLATAIYYECPRMFTFDENDVPESKRRPKRALIPLSGNVAGRYPLIIEKPFSASMGLPF
jgi:predicted nucleic acid-binding protein